MVTTQGKSSGLETELRCQEYKPNMIRTSASLHNAQYINISCNFTSNCTNLIYIKTCSAYTPTALCYVHFYCKMNCTVLLHAWFNCNVLKCPYLLLPVVDVIELSAANQVKC